MHFRLECKVSDAEVRIEGALEKFERSFVPQAVAKLTGGRPPPLAGHFEVFGPPVTTLLILLSDL